MKKWLWGLLAIPAVVLPITLTSCSGFGIGTSVSSGPNSFKKGDSVTLRYWGSGYQSPAVITINGIIEEINSNYVVIDTGSYKYLYYASNIHSIEKYIGN